MCSEQLDVMLVKASDVRAMPGRKSDVSDAEWWAVLAAHGLVRPSLVPTEDIRQLRDLTRSRTTPGAWCQTTTCCAAPGHAPGFVVVVAERTPLSDSSDALPGTHRSLARDGHRSTPPS